MADELEIVGSLSSSLPDERRTAMEHLDRMGTGRALELLFSALSDERWRIRKAAIDALALWEKPREVVENIIKFLGSDSDATRRNAAVEILIRIGVQAVDQLLASLRHVDPHVRKLVVDVLGAIADPRTESEIIATLSDSDDNVRMAAAEALSNYKDGGAARALLRLLSGPDVPMRFYAMESLAKMNVSLPIEELRPLVHQRVLRRAALDALGACPEIESVEFLLDALGDVSRTNRYAAVRSFGKLYREHPKLRNDIERELKARSGHNRINKAFIEALESSKVEVQRAAIHLLGITTHPDSARPLIEVARDNRLQSEAIEVLKKIAEKYQNAVKKAMPQIGDPMRELVRDLVEFPGPAPTTLIAIERPIVAGQTMTEAQFRGFRNYLHEICGIYFNDDMQFVLEKRLLRRLEALNIKDFSGYLEYVMERPEGAGEIGEAINILTTNETYFFREKFQLEAFQKEILPAIHAEKKARSTRRLRIWSAGCSSGEEVYTIAILVDQSGLFKGWDVKILGNDISSRVLQKAEKGIYSSSSFRETPDHYLKKYFKKHDEEHYSVVDYIRRMVEFREINLINQEKVARAGIFDVIFCRNVIIYFDLDMKRRVIDYLFNVLDPGGYLLLGHSESLLNISTRFDLVHLKSDMVYRKPGAVGVGRS